MKQYVGISAEVTTEAEKQALGTMSWSTQTPQFSPTATLNNFLQPPQQNPPTAPPKSSADLLRKKITILSQLRSSGSLLLKKYKKRLNPQESDQAAQNVSSLHTKPNTFLTALPCLWF